jgi:hypothetical protein
MARSETIILVIYKFSSKNNQIWNYQIKIYIICGGAKTFGAVPNASGGVQIISGGVRTPRTPQKIRAWSQHTISCTAWKEDYNRNFNTDSHFVLKFSSLNICWNLESILTFFFLFGIFYKLKQIRKSKYYNDEIKRFTYVTSWSSPWKTQVGIRQCQPNGPFPL